MKQSISHLLLLFVIFTTQAQTDSKARWIYYPGEFEIYLSKKINSQRTERNQHYPPFWRLDAPYGTVQFTKQVELAKEETIRLQVEGKYYFTIDGVIQYDFTPNAVKLPAGKHTLQLMVENYNTLPSIRIEGETVVTNADWQVRLLDGRSVAASVYHNATSPIEPPSTFKLATTPIDAKIIDRTDRYTLYDFGRNTFGFPVLQGVRGSGTIHLYYGESREEAMADKIAETWDVKTVDYITQCNDTLPTKAFRFVKVATTPGVSVEHLSALYEYLPVDYRGSFSCSNPLLNQIYNTSIYTFHLTTREAHLDGIKRDRWAWSGDALQSYWMNFYSFFDENVNKRTLWGLRGHSPIRQHINTILDYSYYWLIGVESHFEYTGDSLFVRQIYPRMQETFDFCYSRLNAEGLAEGRPDDWVFVDWAPISKSGVLSFEQLLYVKSLLSMKTCAQVAGDYETARTMEARFEKAKEQFDSLFWLDEKKAYAHNRVNGELMSEVTRYTNMFAILFNLTDDQRKEQIKNSVILNSDVLQITTPYMKFYELAALCEIGEQKRVLDFVESYWGGMLRLGATTFWETYDPTLPDDKHYDMYGRPFGKSLCHAWGANPIYLFGRYYLGVKPTEAGYAQYTIEPNLGGLEWIEGAVPTPRGNIHVKATTKRIEVTTPESGVGKLIIHGKRPPRCSDATVEKVGETSYMLTLSRVNKTYVVNL